MAGDCEGWGIEPFGIGPWGSTDIYSPLILRLDPSCGQEGVHPCTPITLVVADKGCSGFDLDCARITINGDLIYDGTGLSFAAGTENDGWVAPCNNGSTVTRVVDATYGYNYQFKIICTCFGCDEVVEIDALFCDKNGNTVSVDCSFTAVNCCSISSVEIIDKTHYLLRFSTPLKGGSVLNPDLYNPTTYTVTPVSLGYTTGIQPLVQAVLVEKTKFPQVVILELNSTTDGAAYQFSASRNIVDIYGSVLIERGAAVAISRRTKLDFMLDRLPEVYDKSIIVNDRTRLSPVHILAVMGIEDERSGGQF
jgi:hypothetical protein